MVDSYLNPQIISFINYFYDTTKNFDDIKMELRIEEKFNKHISIMLSRNGYNVGVSYAYIFFESFIKNDPINQARHEALKTINKLLKKEGANENIGKIET